MWLIITVFLFVCAPVCGFSAEPGVEQSSATKRATIERLLVLTGEDAIPRQELNTLLAEIAPRPSLQAARLRDAVRAAIVPEEAQAGSVQAYADRFSDEEIAQLIAFYETPAGSKLASLRNEIRREETLAARAWATILVRKTLKTLRIPPAGAERKIFPGAMEYSRDPAESPGEK
jgi:hypothetical protein